MAVPSVAFLDDLSRWNAVILLDRLGRPIEDAVAVVQVDRCVSDRAPPAGPQRG